MCMLGMCLCIHLYMCCVNSLQQKHEVDPSEDRVWLVHKEGFSLGTVMPENPAGKRGSELSRQTSLVRGSRESYKVKLHSGKVIDVDEEDLEKVSR